MGIIRHVHDFLHGNLAIVLRVLMAVLRGVRWLVRIRTIMDDRWRVLSSMVMPSLTANVNHLVVRGREDVRIMAMTIMIVVAVTMAVAMAAWTCGFARTGDSSDSCKAKRSHFLLKLYLQAHKRGLNRLNRDRLLTINAQTYCRLR